MSESEEAEVVSWRWLNWSIVLVLVGIVLLIAVISAGIFDPTPVGDLRDTIPLQALDLDDEQQRLVWLEQTAPDGNHTLRLRAALSAGEVDSAYGLTLGEDEQFATIAFSPAGYVSFWQRDGDQLEKIIPWRTWPHVRLGQEANELWLDVVEGNLTSVRTNREVLWQGEVPLKGRRIGLWAETFGGPATIDFQQLEIFASAPAA